MFIHYHLTLIMICSYLLYYYFKILINMIYINIYLKELYHNVLFWWQWYSFGCKINKKFKKFNFQKILLVLYHYYRKQIRKCY